MTSDRDLDLLHEPGGFGNILPVHSHAFNVKLDCLLDELARFFKRLLPRWSPCRPLSHGGTDDDYRAFAITSSHPDSISLIASLTFIPMLETQIATQDIRQTDRNLYRHKAVGTHSRCISSRSAYRWSFEP